MKELTAIQGLRLESRYRLNNGPESHVVPFASQRTFNVVYHGAEKFEYGHYGIHLGQEDQLTFMGSSKQRIKAYFIDCRLNSLTAKRRLIVELTPSTGQTLCIPPGVAHSFEGLENICTLNSYASFLPDPEDFASGRSKWNMANDVINLSMDVRDEDIPLYIENPHPASDDYYGYLAEIQRNALKDQDIEYPLTRDLAFASGSKVRVMLKKRVKAQPPKTSESIAGIDGVRWVNHPVIKSSEHSGFVPFLAQRPYYIVDHGETFYTHDAYGIHLGQEDNLTFLGADGLRARLKLVDCRSGSKTLHQEISFEFEVNPKRTLIIPPGVAHAFEAMENIYTINQPRVFLREDLSYDSGNDVIDWPLNRYDYPILKTNPIEAWSETYAQQVIAQTEVMKKPPRSSTPAIALTKNENGDWVKVALRKKAHVA